MKSLLALFSLASVLALTGCVNNTQQPTPTDYSAFRASKPRSILVLLPKNQTPDVKASHSFLSKVTLPLAESGYYVFPVAVVDQTFKQNGVTTADDIHSISIKKLHDIFGADAALYLNISDYGTLYQILNSSTSVTADARLVDLRSGQELWKSSATASSQEDSASFQNSLLGMLVNAALTHIANTVQERAHEIAGITSARLLTAGTNGALLYGSRSPNYEKPQL